MMGTSASFRSPLDDRRWRLVNRAYDAGLPLERVRAEIFNAGNVWLTILTDAGMARFVEAAVRAHGELEASLIDGNDAGHALYEWAAEARQQAIADGGAAGAAIGERALITMLVRTISESAPVDSLKGAEAAQAWRQARGEPAELAHRFLRAVLEQYTRHVVARDMGRLVEEGRSPRETRKLTRELGRAAGEVAESMPAREATTPQAWRLYLTEAFERGGALPR